MPTDSPLLGTYVFNEVLKNFERRADHVAISAGPVQICYQKLGQLVADIRNSIKASGLKRGETLALITKDRWGFIPAMIASIGTGNPFFCIDPTTPRARIISMIQRAKPIAFIGDKITLETLNSDAKKIEFTQNGMSKIEQLNYLEIFPLENQLQPREFGNVYFTSGSTGNPKAIAGKFDGVDAFIKWEIEAAAADKDCRVSQLGPPIFDGFLKDVFVPLCSGGTVCVLADTEAIFKPEKLSAWLANECISILHTVPSVLRQMMNENSCSRLSNLKTIVLAGEPVRPKDVERLFQTFGNHVRALNLYGPTETTLTKLFHFLQPIDGSKKSVPIGVPMPDSKAAVLNETGSRCPPGVVGEIVIASPYCALHYIDEPELTASRFIPDLNLFGERAYRTGDLGSVNENDEYEFHGRIDNQIKIRGVRIEAEEIESVFSRHEKVLHAAAITINEDSEEPALICCCVTKEDISPDALREFASGQLPHYMLPSKIVTLKQIPLTPNGKLDKQLLVQMIASQKNPTEKAELSSTQQRLLAIFQELLATESIDAESSFFVQGGHSLIAMKLLATIYRQFGIEIALRDLFASSSVKELGTIIDEKREHQ